MSQDLTQRLQELEAHEGANEASLSKRDFPVYKPADYYRAVALARELYDLLKQAGEALEKITEQRALIVHKEADKVTGWHEGEPIYSAGAITGFTYHMSKSVAEFALTNLKAKGIL